MDKKPFDQLSKEERSEMTTSFLEKTMAGYDSDPDSPEDYSNNASSNGGFGRIHPDDLFLQSSTKFVEWHKQCQNQDRDTIWDSWHKIYAIFPESRFLLAVKDDFIRIYLIYYM